MNLSSSGSRYHEFETSPDPSIDYARVDGRIRFAGAQAGRAAEFQSVRNRVGH